MKFSFSSFSLSFLLACAVVDATYDIKRSLDDTCDGTDFDERSSVITNDIPWVDNCGDKIKANRGGTISEKIDEYYYMIGSESKPYDPEVNHDAGTIYIYRSKNLGSNSWEFVNKIEGKNARSCAMNYNPSTNKVVVHCRKIVCVADHPWGEYNCSVPMLNVGDNTRKVGGSSMFRQGNDLYFVTSRVQKEDTIPVNQKPNRFVVVYKLTENWLQVYETTVEREYNRRESPYIVEHEEEYYLFTSRSKEWKNSTTQYLRASSLEGLKDAGEEQVTFYPENTNKIKSMGTQFTFAQKFDDENGEERYMFGGRHHPLEDPCNFAPQWGSHKMAPLRFDDAGIPEVYWKKSFDWKMYNYNTPTFDQHDKEYYQPVCDKPDSEKFDEGYGNKKGCPWVARKNTEKRCNDQPGTIAHCQATCSDYCDYTEGGTCNKFCDYTIGGFCNRIIVNDGCDAGLCWDNTISEWISCCG